MSKRKPPQVGVDSKLKKAYFIIPDDWGRYATMGLTAEQAREFARRLNEAAERIEREE